ncbi:TrbC/VirB2 family protein [Sphingopyxis sp.]|uniref:TrbC/VirB2 family protein n=1 Tax=Sphingopyxis sp. TaxID=1908224 RepID=UPI002EDBABB0
MHIPTTSLTDPPANSPVADGITWVQGVALGSTATTVAVLAVATFGILMLSGRLELRRGIAVVIGCFILFGASAIAAALTGFGGSGAAIKPPPATDIRPPLQTPAPPTPAYDPYAGASVPSAR